MPTGEAELGLERRAEAAAIAAEGPAPRVDAAAPCRFPSAAGLHLLPHAHRKPRASLRRPASPRSISSRLRSARGSGFRCLSRRARSALSAAAIASPPVYDRARAAARYSDAMRELIQSFKYRDRQEGLPCSRAGSPRPAPNFSPTPISSFRCRSIRRGCGGGGLTNPQCSPWRWAALPRPRRLLRAEAGAADGEPSGAHRRPAAPQCRRGLQGR